MPRPRFRYSAWDGTQRGFEVDAPAAASVLEPEAAPSGAQPQTPGSLTHTEGSRSNA